MLSLVSSRRRSHKFWLATAATALATTGTVTGLSVLLLSGGSDNPRAVAHNISRNFRACLITSEPDQPTAQTAWSGLQNAARTTPVNAQRIITPSTATTTTALLPYIESLVQRECGLIISTGPHLDAAITAAAKNHPHQHFVTTGTPIALPNVTTLPTPTAAAITDAVHTASQGKAGLRS
jgi:basic membrane lipoprotein Med (substrate-binding protein (PBP1-ABC) superfamily)